MKCGGDKTEARENNNNKKGKSKSGEGENINIYNKIEQQQI